jgi:hypothetical protein
MNAASHTIGSTLVANATGVYHTGTVNAASHTVGTDFIANTTGAFHTGTMNAASHTIGSTLVANTTGVYHTGVINAASITTTALNANTTGVTVTGFANVSTSVNTALLTVGTAFIANTTGVYHTGTINAASISIGGGGFIANSTAIVIADPVTANGGTGTAGQVLISNGSSGSPYWANAASGGGGFTNAASISSNTTAVKSTLYIFTANLALTLPASPVNGDQVGVTNLSNTITCVISRNSSYIMGLTEDLTVDVKGASLTLIYSSNASVGWVLL